MTSPRRVFISYQRADDAFARHVREHLTAHGVTTWMDQYDIPVGAYWPDEIDKGLAGSDVVVGILSPDSVESRNVKNEWDWAIQNGKRLLLLQVKPCVVPHRYVSINFIDATGRDQSSSLSALLQTLGIESPSSDAVVPPTMYARSGDVNIAFKVVGDGPIDLVLVPGWVSNVDAIWEEPTLRRFHLRLASFSRVIVFDKRGTGLSDRVTDLPTLEQRMDDMRAVMDAVGCERAALLGVSEGGSMSALFAATYPARTSALILYGTFAKRIWSPDYPWAPTPAERQRFFDVIERDWGGIADLPTVAPSVAADEHFKAWFGRYSRHSASPGAALALARMNTEIDIRHILPSVQSPTLVLHRTGDLDANVEEGRYIAERIPSARFVELAGIDHIPFVGDSDAILDEIERFLAGLRPTPAVEYERVLATVLSVALSAPDVDMQHLDNFHEHARQEVDRYRGRVEQQAGDALLATFDGPARAIRCAVSVADALRSRGVEVRAGLHTGEVELLDDEIRGHPVRVAGELATLAGAGEVIISNAVKDLVAGSGIRFEERGTRSLAGVPEEWRVYAVSQASPNEAAS